MDYFTKENGGFQPVKNIATYGYYMAGYQREEDKGVLTTLQFVVGAGTCLVPVFDKNGNAIVKPEYAGMYVNQISEPVTSL